MTTWKYKTTVHYAKPPTVMTFTKISQTPKTEETPQFSLKLLLLFLIILFALSANFVIFCDQSSATTSPKEKVNNTYELPSNSEKEDVVLNINKSKNNNKKDSNN